MERAVWQRPLLTPSLFLENHPLSDTPHLSSPLLVQNHTALPDALTIPLYLFTCPEFGVVLPLRCGCVGLEDF